MKKKKLLLIMLAVLTGCFSFVPVKAQAKDQAREMEQSVCLAESMHPGTAPFIAKDTDVPEEVKEPIEKGKSLITYIIRVFGWLIVIFGVLFFAISFFSHQTDQRITGIIAFFVGLLVAFAPEIAKWITG